MSVFGIFFSKPDQSDWVFLIICVIFFGSVAFFGERIVKVLFIGKNKDAENFLLPKVSFLKKFCMFFFAIVFVIFSVDTVLYAFR